PVMSTPAAWIRPSWGRTRPVRTFTSVVLPAPLGPIRPVTAPAAMEIDTPSSARTPPKRQTTPVATRSGSSIVGPGCRPRPSERAGHRGLATAADDPFGTKDDDGDEQGAEEHVAVRGCRPDGLGERGEHDRPEDRADHRRHAADDSEDQHEGGTIEAVLRGVDEEVHVGVERAGPGGEHRPDHEGGQLVAGRVDSAA